MFNNKPFSVNLKRKKNTSFPIRFLKDLQAVNFAISPNDKRATFFLSVKSPRRLLKTIKTSH